MTPFCWSNNMVASATTALSSGKNKVACCEGGSSNKRSRSTLSEVALSILRRLDVSTQRMSRLDASSRYIHSVGIFRTKYIFKRKHKIIIVSFCSHSNTYNPLNHLHSNLEQGTGEKRWHHSAEHAERPLQFLPNVSKDEASYLKGTGGWVRLLWRKSFQNPLKTRRHLGRDHRTRRRFGVPLLKMALHDDHKQNEKKKKKLFDDTTLNALQWNS